MVDKSHSHELSDMPPNSAVHPLDPLTAPEISLSTRVLREQKGLSKNAMFVALALEEPSKESLTAQDRRNPNNRSVRVVVLDKTDGSIFEGLISLTHETVEQWDEVISDGQPPFLLEELLSVERIVKMDDAWRAAIRRRGIADLESVQVDPFSAGHLEQPNEHGRRIVRALSYLRPTETSNPYARPIEGLVATIDLTTGEVIGVLDDISAPSPSQKADKEPDVKVTLRTDLRPIEISQPEGPSFSLDGHELRWQKWRLRLGLNAREGLVLHDVRYEDDGRIRSVVHRAALSELFVPYSDPRPAHFWRGAFDVGESGLGRLTTPLVNGCDCLGEIRYLDGVIADDSGQPVTIPNAICIHEEDYGILWRHADFRSDNSEVRRSRRLVVSTFANLANYDYGFYWYLYLDGSIQFEAKLTGIVLTTLVPEGYEYSYGTKVASGLAAITHQHFFNVRLDMAVDGIRNSVYEVDVVPESAEDNPHGNAFISSERLLLSEQGATRISDPSRSRFWRIVNRQVLNPLGQPVGYRLVPQASPSLLADSNSSFAKRAAFATRHLWVTRFKPDERFAAGDFPNQHPGGDGLPRWIERDDSIVDEDIVLWHTFGVTHLPRPEDWPIMPVEYVGFWLKPDGFFDQNPSLDVPPPAACHTG